MFIEAFTLSAINFTVFDHGPVHAVAIDEANQDYTVVTVREVIVGRMKLGETRPPMGYQVCENRIPWGQNRDIQCSTATLKSQEEFEAHMDALLSRYSASERRTPPTDEEAKSFQFLPPLQGFPTEYED